MGSKTPLVKNIPRCPNCNSIEVRWRINTDDWCCRRCGFSWKKEEVVITSDLTGKLKIKK